METFVPYKNVIDGKAGLNHLINPTTAKTAVLPALRRTSTAIETDSLASACTSCLDRRTS